jgi:DNA-binding FadR family transcriptional regulator
MATTTNSARRASIAVGQGGVRAPKTADLVVRHLRRLIIRGELKEGDALPPESDLMDEFQVSRPTMREAIRMLEAEGLISVRRGAHGGARVIPPTEVVAARYAGLLLQYRNTPLKDIYDARALLEAPAAGLAAKRRKKTDLTRLEKCVNEAQASDDSSEMLGCHHDFHSLVVEIAGSESIVLLSAMLDTILAEAQQSFVADRPSPATREKLLRKSQRTHERLLELIEARDAEGAEELWRRHLIEGGQEVLKGLPETTVLEFLA